MKEQDGLTPFEKANARQVAVEQRRQSERAIFPEGCTNLEEVLIRCEAEIIKKALTLKGGGLVEAAKVLGITHQGLRYILDTRQRPLAGIARVKLTRAKRKAA